MKHILTSLICVLALTSCHTLKTSKREIIEPGAPIELAFHSDETTLRARNQRSGTNPIDILRENIAYSKAEIAATAFNGFEDCCIFYIDNYNDQKEIIEGIFNIIIREALEDAVIVYNKTTTSDNHTYTSVITLELKKEKLLNELKKALIDENIIDPADSEALIKTVDKHLIPKT